MHCTLIFCVLFYDFHAVHSMTLQQPSLNSMESMDGRGGSISLEEETTRMALLLGSISKGYPCCHSSVVIASVFINSYVLHVHTCMCMSYQEMNAC